MSDSPRPLSVLVVDDSPDTVGSLSELLAIAGCAVRGALSGAEALRLAAAETPDVVILDIMMPGMDGCEVARRLVGGGKRPLLVAVTGCGTDADRARTAAAGFHLHLVKPVDPALLLGLLRRVRRDLDPPAARRHDVDAKPLDWRQRPDDLW